MSRRLVRTERSLSTGRGVVAWWVAQPRGNLSRACHKNNPRRSYALPHQYTFTRRYSSLRVANLSSHAVNRRWVMIEQPLRLSCAMAFGFRGLLLNTEAQV